MGEADEHKTAEQHKVKEGKLYNFITVFVCFKHFGSFHFMLFSSVFTVL